MIRFETRKKLYSQIFRKKSFEKSQKKVKKITKQLCRRNSPRIRDTTSTGPNNHPKTISGPEKNHPKNHVFGGFRMFFDRFGRFFEHGKPLGMIGDDFGRFDFRRCSSIFVDFRRVSVGSGMADRLGAAWRIVRQRHGAYAKICENMS